MNRKDRARAKLAEMKARLGDRIPTAEEMREFEDVCYELTDQLETKAEWLARIDELCGAVDDIARAKGEKVRPPRGGH